MDFWRVPPEIVDNFELVWEGTLGNPDPGSMQFRLSGSAEAWALTPCFPRSEGRVSTTADILRIATDRACGIGLFVFTTPTCELEPYRTAKKVRPRWGS